MILSVSLLRFVSHINFPPLPAPSSSFPAVTRAVAPVRRIEDIIMSLIVRFRFRNLLLISIPMRNPESTSLRRCSFFSFRGTVFFLPTQIPVKDSLHAKKKGRENITPPPIIIIMRFPLSSSFLCWMISRTFRRHDPLVFSQWDKENRPIYLEKKGNSPWSVSTWSGARGECFGPILGRNMSKQSTHD